MAENSKISWCDHSWNASIGCTKISPGCTNCYAAEMMDVRYKRAEWGPNGTRSVTAEANWKEPLKWNRIAAMRGTSLTYGEAVTVYGKELPECEGHEWDNRTTEENNQWLRDNGVDPLRKPRVFLDSLADPFENWEGPMVNASGREVWIDGRGWFVRGENYTGDGRLLTMDDVRARWFKLIDATPNLSWLVLTKRPENILRMWAHRTQHESEHYYCDEGYIDQRTGEAIDGVHRCRPEYRNNVWLGCSVENQEYAEKRIPELLKCRDLSTVLFLSCEPLLGPVDLRRVPIEGFNLPHLDVLRRGWWSGDWRGFQNSHNAPSIDWVIVGGESGPNARPMHPDWARYLRDECEASRVPFHFKQHGEWIAMNDYDPFIHSMDIDSHKSRMMFPNGVFSDEVEKGNRRDYCQSVGTLPISVMRVGTKRSGRLLDGVLHDAFPEVQA